MYMYIYQTKTGTGPEILQTGDPDGFQDIICSFLLKFCKKLTTKKGSKYWNTIHPVSSALKQKQNKNKSKRRGRGEVRVADMCE